MEKMTRVEAIEMAIELAKGAKATELEEKLSSMLEAEQKARGRKTVSKTAKEKIADMAKIEQLFDTLDPKKFYSSQEILAMIPEFEGYTPQKMTPRLNGLVENGVIVKGNSTKDKKKVGYKLVTDEQEAQEA